MLDHPKPIPVVWTQDVQRGDVVLFHFPSPAEPGPVLPRPCLVLDRTTTGGDVRLTLAPGKTATGTVRTSPHVSLKAPAEVLAAGLHVPVRFDLGMALTVSTRNASFANDMATGTPVLGPLTGASKEQMFRVLARLQAKRDMAEMRIRARSNCLDAPARFASRLTLP